MDFKEAYSGTPPWEIDAPQPHVMQLAAEGGFTGAVLDVGCGTGENALHLAEAGHEVVGVDMVESAIERARDKARRRKLTARFQALDVRHLAELGRSFDTVLDSGLFHVFSVDERKALIDAVGAILKPRGAYHVLCFSDAEPGDWGPHRVTRQELESAFAVGWQLQPLKEARYHTHNSPEGSRAWLATAIRDARGALT